MKFENFLADVPPYCHDDILEINNYLQQSGCKVKTEMAKSGYVVSYNDAVRNKVLLNFVFRKSGLYARLYADNINSYISLMNEFPEEILKRIEKASVCKRILDPSKCNSRCAKGYIFNINGTEYIRCRFNCFLMPVLPEYMSFIKKFIEFELEKRAS